MNKLLPLLNTNAKAAIAILALLLVSEYLIMLLIELLQTAALDIAFLKAADWKIVNSIVLTAIIAPAFYFLISRLQKQQAEIETQLDELHHLQQEVGGHERRMKELMEEIAILGSPLSAENTGNSLLASDSAKTMRHTAGQYATARMAVGKQRSEQLLLLEDLDVVFKNIRQAYQEWAHALDEVSDPIFMHDKEFLVLRCNRAYQRCAGLSLKQIIGQPYYEIFPRADAPLPSCLRAMQTSDDEQEELVVVGDASYRSRAFSVHDGNQGHLYSVHILEDITERKQAEESLIAAEEQFRSLVEQSLAGIYIIQDNKFAYVNPRFAEIRGYDAADELVGLDPLLMIAEKDRGIVMENNRRLLAGEVRSIFYDFTALRKDGNSIEVGVHSVLATHNGHPAIIGMQQDISEKKRAEERIQHYIGQLKTAVMSTVGVATTLSEMRDPYTTTHARRVAELAVAIGAELGFDESRQEGLRVAGSLHDIGKITIPAEILSKPGKISAIEFQLIQGHSQASHDVLKGVEWPWPVADIALQHHERTDGSGYPQGLNGDDIIFEARIMAVADVVEAMSSHRPYRPGLGTDKALAEIERGCGSTYDETVANACLTLFREKDYHLPA